jgi:hypothetical protein
VRTIRTRAAQAAANFFMGEYFSRSKNHGGQAFSITRTIIYLLAGFGKSHIRKISEKYPERPGMAGIMNDIHNTKVTRPMLSQLIRVWVARGYLQLIRPCRGPSLNKYGGGT